MADKNFSIPPQNLQAEQAVLGACLISSEELSRVTEILKPDDFYDFNNKLTYEIIFNLYSANKPVDLVSFQSEAISRGVFDRLGGQPYMAELIDNGMITAHAVYYSELVKNASIRRKFIEAGTKITSLAEKSEITNSEIIDEAEKIILSAAGEKDSSAPELIKNLLPSLLTKTEELKSGVRKNTGFLSNFTDLDGILTGGFQAGTLNIIAARPSMGKTALALNVAQFGGNQEKNSPILFFSLEMSMGQILQRMLSAETLDCGQSVKLSSILSGELSDYDSYTLGRASEKLQERKIFIYDISELSAMEFRTKCRRFKIRHPDLSLIVVDYLQLMNSGRKNDNNNRQYEIAEISRIMKSVAVELNCPVIALSQLSRETERRTEKKPQLSDLRDSGAIEQDADTVMLLYREDYYSSNENNSDMNSVAEIRVAKNRNGKTGMCKLIFSREFTRFLSYGSE